MTDIVERLRRSPDQYAGTSPNAVASGSKAQMMYFVEDAQKDIAALINTITALRARVGELEGHVAAVRSVEAGLDGLLSLTDFTSDDFREARDALSDAQSDLSARLSNRYNIILSALEVAGNAFQLASFHARSILSSTEDEK